MSKSENKKPQNNNPAPHVVERCPAEDCGKKPKRMHFCEEHFEWFKAGLINRMGQKPSDFDKKYQSYQRKKAA